MSLLLPFYTAVLCNEHHQHFLSPLGKVLIRLSKTGFSLTCKASGLLKGRHYSDTSRGRGVPRSVQGFHFAQIYS